MQQAEIWQSWGRGELSDDEAHTLLVAAHARNAAHQGGVAAAKRLASAFASPRRRPCKSPDKQRSRERRDMLAGMAALSPMMAIGFTHSEKAVIAVVVALAARVGGCTACLEEIAARSGVSVSTVKRALAKARLRALLDRRERRRPGRPSLPNVVRIRDRELRERTQQRMQWKGRSPNLNVHGPTRFKQEGRRANERADSRLYASQRSMTLQL